MDALLADIRSAAENGAVFRSVFIGGGTPSLIDPTLLAEVLRSLPTSDGAEVTVESNPDDVSEAWVSALRDAGMTRLSLGVQSTVDHVLSSLNRRHDRGNVATAIAAIQRVGVPSLNVDLIYGAVGESLGDWRQSVDEAISWGTTHVSAYALTVEGGTALATDPARAPDEDDQADKYELASELLGAAGYANYEVSNWARSGFECLHNWTYWRQSSYLGFGCAAHSHIDGHRWWNVRTPDRYIEKVSSGASPVSASERLDPAARALEALQLSLRTREGVPALSFSDVDLGDLVAGGLIDVRDSIARLSVRGRLVANAVTHLLCVPGSTDETLKSSL